jgi:hypothetical protein
LDKQQQTIPMAPQERRPSFWDTRLADVNPFDTTAKEKGEPGLTDAEIQDRVRQGSVPEIHGEAEALAIARKGGWEIDALMTQMELERVEENYKPGFFDLQFKNPKHFTWLLVGFASMGGLLSGLDQSLISGANLYMPKDLGLTVKQNSLVDSGMPLGAVGGALLLSPINEYLGRRMAIIISIVLYTIGAALEAGSQSYGMIIAGRVILGIGVGLEGGTGECPTPLHSSMEPVGSPIVLYFTS